MSAAGTVVSADTSGLNMATGQGTLRLLKLQRTGGKMLPTADFLRGFSVATGTQLSSVPMKSLVAKEPFKRLLIR